MNRLVDIAHALNRTGRKIINARISDVDVEKEGDVSCIRISFTDGAATWFDIWPLEQQNFDDLLSITGKTLRKIKDEAVRLLIDKYGCTIKVIAVGDIIKDKWMIVSRTM